MIKQQTTADCLYVCGDSWAHGSELVNPDVDESNGFAPVHETYRTTNYWPRLVADRLGVDLIDGSYPGASNDRILRCVMYDVAKLLEMRRRPFVVVAWTQLQRFELPEVKPDGGVIWRSFVSPKSPGEHRVAMDIWRDWSSDRTDVVKWLQQIISLDLFLKANKIDYLATTVFKDNYRLFQEYQQDPWFNPYLAQIRQHVVLSRHALNISLETVLRQYNDVAYGPGGHPLKRGHELLAAQVYAQINSKFQFQRLRDQSSAT